MIAYPAVTIQSKDMTLNDFILQVNRAFEQLDSASSSGVIPDRSIEGIKLVLGAVGTDELAMGAVTGDKIAGSTITGAHIALGTITASKLNVSKLSDITADAGTITKGAFYSDQWTKNSGLSVNITDGDVIVGGTQGWFSVDKYGQMVSKVANVSGTVYALAGDIGGMPIDQGIYGVDVGYKSTGAYWGSGNNILIASPTGSYRLWAGHANATSAPFLVTSGGQLISTSSQLSGVTLGNTTLTGTLSGGTLSSNAISGATITLSAISGGTISKAAISEGTISKAAISDGTISGTSISKVSIGGSSVINDTELQFVTLTGEISGGTLDGVLLEDSATSNDFTVNGKLTLNSGNVILGTSYGIIWGVDTKLTRAAAGVLAVEKAIQTFAPTSGTAGVWKLGTVESASVSVDTSNYLKVDVDGTTVKIAICT